jgi:maleylacetoacetate isomerase
MVAPFASMMISGRDHAPTQSAEAPLQLYTYFRSSAAFRARIAFNLKDITPEMISVHLTRNGGAQFEDSYRAVNPQMRVPALKLDNGEILLQSLAIMEYLDETKPSPPFLPKDPVSRAKVRAVAQIISCDIHPLNNSSVLTFLRTQLNQPPEIVNTKWYHHWVMAGFDAIEPLLHHRRYLPGAAGLQRPPVQGAARQISEDHGRRRRLPEATGIREGQARKPARRGMSMIANQITLLQG